MTTASPSAVRTLDGAPVLGVAPGLWRRLACFVYEGVLLFGVLAGYFGRRIDDGVFFVMSTLSSMPSVLLLVAMITALPKSTASVCVALGVTSWVAFCRLARGETFKLRELDYVAAARALGASHTRIIWRHILPNLMHLVLIRFVLLFSGLGGLFLLLSAYVGRRRQLEERHGHG